MSKGVEAIKELRYIVLKFCEDNNKQDAYCIELCDIIEKELKALEIIKKKNVDIFELKCCSSAKAYNNCISFKIGFVKNYELTQEEYELLKEVLEND